MNDVQKYLDSYGQLARLEEPTTAEDLLFAGQAYLSLDPHRAVEYVSKSFDRRKSPLALLLRGRAAADLCMQTGKLEHAEKAIEDVKAAHLVLGDNPGVRVHLLATHLIVANAYLASGDEIACDRHLNEAAEVAREVDSQSSLTRWEAYYLAKYYADIGEREKELQTYRRAQSDYWTDYSSSQYLARLCELGEPQDQNLLARIEGGEIGPLSAGARAFLLVLEGKPDAAIVLSGKFADSSNWLSARMAAIDLRDICANHEGAKELAKRQIDWQRELDWDPWSAWARDHILPYQAGVSDDQRLLNDARTSEYPRRWLMCAHWAIAMKSLGEGDLQRAREHLRSCAQQCVIYYHFYSWSRALLRRLESAGSWPSDKAVDDAAHSRTPE